MFFKFTFFFFKQKTAYEMRISDWSSDVCSSDLRPDPVTVEWLAGEMQRRYYVGCINLEDVYKRQERISPLLLKRRTTCLSRAKSNFG